MGMCLWFGFPLFLWVTFLGVVLWCGISCVLWWGVVNWEISSQISLLFIFFGCGVGSSGISVFDGVGWVKEGFLGDVGGSILFDGMWQSWSYILVMWVPMESSVMKHVIGVRRSGVNRHEECANVVVRSFFDGLVCWINA